MAIVNFCAAYIIRNVLTREPEKIVELILDGSAIFQDWHYITTPVHLIKSTDYKRIAASGTIVYVLMRDCSIRNILSPEEVHEMIVMMLTNPALTYACDFSEVDNIVIVSMWIREVNSTTDVGKN